MAVRFCFSPEARAMGAVAPRPGIPGEDAGYDLRALTRCEFPPLSQHDVPTGIHFEIPGDLFGLVCSRTSVAKRGLIPVYHVVDPGFVGELTLRLYNTQRDETVIVEPGERVAQIVFIPFWSGPLEEIGPDELKKTTRGEGRVGSTGR